jgi:multiple sugar transport system substrate-binding protein
MTITRKILLACAALGLSIGAVATARAETVRITVSYYSAATGPYFEKMAAAFHAANPGTDVKIDVINWDSLLQKLRTDISGGTNPDISIIGTRWLLDFVKDGLAEPLDGYMTPEFKARFIPPFLKPATIDGKIYGLPIAASARALFYNKPMLAQAGFPNGPTTWDDVVAASQKLKGAGSPGYGIMAKGTEVDVYYYYALWSYGGDVVDAQNKAAFASPAGVKALTLYKSMIDNGLTQSAPTNYTRADIQDLFKQGRLGMVATGPWLIGQISREVPNLDYGIVPMPKGTTVSTYAVTDSIVMFANSKVKPAAYKFLDYIFTKDPRIEFNKNEGFLPTTSAVAQDPSFANDPRLKTFVDLLPNAHFAPTVTGWEDTAKAVTDAVQSVYIGKAEPEAALKQAASQADEFLGK